MSGRIIINGEPTENEEPYYPIVKRTDVDTVCGTTGLSMEFTTWNHRFLCGSLKKTFEKCVQSIDYKMSSDMRYFSSKDNDDPVALFCEQMIPHHQNAVNMAKSLMKLHPEEVAAVDDFGGLLMDIVNGQNYQIHQFRAYLEGDPSERFCKRDYRDKFTTVKHENEKINNTRLLCRNAAYPKACNEDTDLRAFCPNGCGLPCRTSCLDTLDSFMYKSTKVTSCGEVALSTPKNRDRMCMKVKEVGYLCPVTCGLCHGKFN